MVKNTKTVLVTGAAGFIGSHLAKRLEDEGYKVKLVDDFSRGRQEYLDYLGVKAQCIRMDLREYTGYNKGYFEDVDEVYHCACRIGNNEYLHGSPKNKLRALQDNLAIDNTVFRICNELGIKKIIYTSSVSVYNVKKQRTFEDAIFSEDDLEGEQIHPEGGYGLAKFIGEKQLQIMSKNGIKTGIVRIFKSYGPCDDYSDESGQVITTLMRKAINYPKEKFVLWGDGQVTRCLVYIDDLIDGIIKLSNYCDKESLIVNMGGKQPFYISELARKIISLTNKDVNIENDMSKPIGVKSRIPVLSLASKKLDWRPTTSIEKGLIETYKWMKYEIANS